jgi:hypothetical protein
MDAGTERVCFALALALALARSPRAPPPRPRSPRRTADHPAPSCACPASFSFRPRLWPAMIDDGFALLSSFFPRAGRATKPHSLTAAPRGSCSRRPGRSSAGRSGLDVPFSQLSLERTVASRGGCGYGALLPSGGALRQKAQKKSRSQSRLPGWQPKSEACFAFG